MPRHRSPTYQRLLGGHTSKFDGLEDPPPFPLPLDDGEIAPHEFPPGSTTTRPKRGNGEGGQVQQAQPQNPAKRIAEALDWPFLAPRTPPERRWAIKGWIGFGHVTLLVGSGGIGKTLLAQQIGSCLALGQTFIEEVPAPFTCLMWACEDDHDELWRRQIALARWCKAGLEAFDQKLVIVPRHGLDNTLVSTDYGKLMYSPRIDELREQAFDLKADVVILDNVAQLYGGNENDRHSVTAFLNVLVGALEGKAIILLAHPSRASGSEFSGSSAWENAARTRLYLGATLPGAKVEPDEQPSDTVRYLSRRKANYSPKDWRRMTYADGALTPDEPADTDGIIVTINRARAQRVILAGLGKLSAMGLYPSGGQKSPNFLPKLIIEYKLDEGLLSRDLASSMRDLMTEGRLKMETIGKTKSRNAIRVLIESS